MVIGLDDQYQDQYNWLAQAQSEICKESISNQELYGCQYDPHLGSDDSDPESQISDTSSTSQDSAHSPATSYSSEESRADPSQQDNEPLDDSWSIVSGPTCNKNSGDSRSIAYRPKTNVNLHQKAAEHANALARQTVIQANLNSIHASNFQNPRRGRSTIATSLPSLRRDTDPTDNIVRMIVLFCTNLINSIWCTQGQAPADNASRQGGNVLPLEVFITETLRRSKTSYSTLQIALYYLILLKQCLPAQAAADKSGCRAMQCGRRMFLTSLILASKYLQDRNYSARAWSKISGLPLKEINDNERRFLSIVNWDLHVPKCTFENWSKIVLQVCRRSQDISGGCKNPDSSFNGPRSGPPAAYQCFLSNANNRAWWLASLRQLKTDVVKCAIKTQYYVESLCPFKSITPITRPISPESDTSSEDSYDSLADILVDTPTGSRQPSLDRSSKRFEPVPDLLHPAAPLAIPPPPTLKNLPTPLTTPQSHVQNYWTPRLAHQSSSSSLRCRASAAALGSAFKKHCPIANLETCPPPIPPPHRACDKVQRSFVPAESVYSTSTSVVSSPESTVSDVFSYTSKSRSSSISSTASWATSSSTNSDLRWFTGNPTAAPSLTRPSLLPVTGCVRAEQGIERPRTAFKVPQLAETCVDPINCERTTPVSCANSGPLLSDASKKSQIEAILAGRQVDESVVRSRARPALSRSGTQIYNPCQEQEPKIQQLKRSRSDTFEFPSTCSSRQYPTLPTPPSNSVTQCSDFLEAPNVNNLRVQPPTQCWAQPRKPLQTGAQNKRLALHISTQYLAAAELASRDRELLLDNVWRDQ